MSAARRIRFQNDGSPDHYEAPRLLHNRPVTEPNKHVTNKKKKPIERESRENTQERNRPTDADRMASRQNMRQSYKHMTETYARQQRELASKPAWVATKTRGAIEPDELTITHVNQTQDLLRAKDTGAKNADKQSSSEWLENHAIENMKLTLKDLVDKGQIGRPGVSESSGKVQQHIQFDAADINEFEYKLNLAIETYTTRIKWLLQGSRRVFGMVKGTRVGVLIDASDANFGFGRLSALQENITHLLDEQISKKKSLYMMSYGSEVNPLWSHAMDVSCRSIQEAKSWVDQLMPSGGSNVLKALRFAFKVPDLDTLLLIQGSSPDQNSEMLCSYIEQLGVGKEFPLQTVAYDCNNHMTHKTLKRLAEESGGRYHCYASASEEQLYTGSDVSSLLAEIQKAQDVINKIKEMRQGLLGTALVSVMNEISSEVAKLPQSRFLPRPPGHELPLNIEMPKFLAASSSEWLAKHGLKAKSLDLYQVLSPNAYSYKEEFIPVIRKTVQSQVHEKAMAQFQWHDGTTKNIHVDLTQLFEYQKQLGATVKIYEKRVDWLSSASRKIFGTICEKNVIILIDLSVSNLNYLVHIQHSLRLLLEQQLANKDYFNLIGFGSEAKAWRATMAIPTPETLQDAWRWILDLQCGGSRNYMAALRMAIENDEEAKHNIDPEGVYLFTSGIPDQPQEVICPYVEEACAGRDMRAHVVLFNVDDYDACGAIPSRYANITKTAESLRNIAHCSGGRFHWFRETGIIESDDIASINLEIEKALNFSKKCAMLVDSVKIKYNLDYKCTDEYIRALPPGVTHPALPAPPPAQPKALPTRPAPAEVNNGQLTGPPRITSRPSSAQRRIEDKVSGSVRRRPQSAKDPMQQVKTNGKKVQQAFFFTDEKHGVGAVFNKYPAPRVPKMARGKPIKAASIPEKEEQLSTKEWLRMYSLVKLKLDLNKLVSGTECRHIAKPVKVLNKMVESKVCSVFPSINVGGTIKHLQLRPMELAEYEKQVEYVLRRYIKRLQWLLSGSRRVFGSVVEKQCIILVDTSGSMEPYMEELRKELVSLTWDQLFRHKVRFDLTVEPVLKTAYNVYHKTGYLKRANVTLRLVAAQDRFNLMQFSGKCNTWMNCVQEPTEENCHAAVQWVSQLQANGNTCTLEALELAFQDSDIDAIYLLTDGKPDSSTSLVLKEVATMNTERNIVIHTISFNCTDTTANNFLKMMAKENKGRFHRCHSDFDAQLFAHKLLTEGFEDHEQPHLPEFEGDDLKRLGTEVNVARKYLSQSKQYRVLLDASASTIREEKNLSNGQVSASNGRIRPASAKV